MRCFMGCILALGLVSLSSQNTWADDPPPPGDPIDPNSLAPPAGFEVTLKTATGGQKKISATGTYKCPDTHEVIYAFLELRKVDGTANPTSPPIIVQNGTWSVTNEAVPAGTYDVYAKFTFRKKNAGVFDLSFPVTSNVEPDKTVSP